MVHVGINFGTALFVSILKHIWIYVICICCMKSHENEMFPVIDEVKLSVHACTCPETRIVCIYC